MPQFLAVLTDFLLFSPVLLLLGSVIVCSVACFRNRHLNEVLTDDIFSIGASTFYGGRRFAHLPMEDETRLSDHRERDSVRGMVNPAGPDHSDPVM